MTWPLVHLDQTFPNQREVNKSAKPYFSSPHASCANSAAAFPIPSKGAAVRRKERATPTSGNTLSPCDWDGRRKTRRAPAISEAMGWFASPFSRCLYSRSCFLFRCRIKLDETPTTACIVSDQSLQRTACLFSSRVISKNCFQCAMLVGLLRA